MEPACAAVVCVMDGARRVDHCLLVRIMQAQAAVASNKRSLMAQNGVLLADLADLQRTNRHLLERLGAATHQLLAAQGHHHRQQHDELPRPDAACQDRPRSPAAAASNTPSGRSQGSQRGGHLLPACEGRLLDAALSEQRRQLTELHGVLDATTAIVKQQAAHIARLQQHAADAEQQQSAPAAGGCCVSADGAAAAAGQGVPMAGRLSPPRANRAFSPVADALARPKTAGAVQGMAADIKAGLAAFRAK